MTAIKSSEVRGLGESELSFVEFKSWVDTLYEKIAAKENISSLDADVIRKKGADVAQAELLALNYYEYGFPDSGLPVANIAKMQGIAAPSAKIFSQAHVRDLFTFSEKIAIYTSPEKGVQVFLDDMKSRSTLDLTHHKFVAGLDYLVSLLLITEARKEAIINNEPV